MLCRAWVLGLRAQGLAKTLQHCCHLVHEVEGMQTGVVCSLNAAPDWCSRHVALSSQLYVLCKSLVNIATYKPDSTGGVPYVELVTPADCVASCKQQQ